MPTTPLTRRSMRRSDVRERVLDALARMRHAHASELALAAETSLRGVYDAMFGRPPRYRRELSLVAVGLAVALHGRVGVEFQITPAGRDQARANRASRGR